MLGIPPIKIVFFFWGMVQMALLYQHYPSLGLGVYHRIPAKLPRHGILPAAGWIPASVPRFFFLAAIRRRNHRNRSIGSIPGDYVAPLIPTAAIHPLSYKPCSNHYSSRAPGSCGWIERRASHLQGSNSSWLVGATYPSEKD